MAAVVQSCADEAGPKTANLPATARSIDVYDTCATAFELGCKATTLTGPDMRWPSPSWPE